MVMVTKNWRRGGKREIRLHLFLDLKSEKLVLWDLMAQCGQN